MRLGPTLMARADALARFTDENGKVSRLHLTTAYGGAARQVLEWMTLAGMAARIDAIGNVVGRYEGTQLGLPALLLGSHIDSVRDAGKYDGVLGVLAAIACVQALNDANERLPFAVEVFAFADEEGVRFPTSMTGSRAIAGNFNPDDLDQADAAGVRLRDALSRIGLDPQQVGNLARRRDDVLGYAELHIEQGPVLEAAGHAVGVVTAIAGASRFNFEVDGRAGHAGTVPMRLRHDALAAAAEIVLAVERRCRAQSELVGTVGELQASPGASNVIPARVRLSVDIRAPDDATHRAAAADVAREIEAIAARRGVQARIADERGMPARACAPALMRQLQDAVAAQGLEPFSLASGALHDATQMAHLTDIAMLFVRCCGGVSHSPLEAITAEDADIGARVLLEFVRNFKPA
jgi:allantoate deiminase